MKVVCGDLRMCVIPGTMSNKATGSFPGGGGGGGRVLSFFFIHRLGPSIYRSPQKIICLQHINFIEIRVTGMTNYLSDSIPASFNCFLFTSKQHLLKQFNIFRKLTLITSQYSSAILFSWVVTL